MRILANAKYNSSADPLYEQFNIPKVDDIFANRQVIAATQLRKSVLSSASDRFQKSITGSAVQWCLIWITDNAPYISELSNMHRKYQIET